MVRSIVWLAVMVAIAIPAAAQTSPQALPMGGTAQGLVTVNGPVEYAVPVKSAGVLTVAVQGSGDLSLQLLDEDGQVLPNGSADRDLNGDEGTELLAATLSESGNYRLRVRMQGGDKTSFTIAGAFLGFPPFQRPSDPDRRPGSARPIVVGRLIEDELDPDAGDMWDWFVLKPTDAGTLTVVTRQVGNGDAPDLVLEVYTDGKFSEAEDRSDRDQQDNSANELVSVQVKAGQPVHVRVSANSQRASKYRVSSSLAP